LVPCSEKAAEDNGDALHPVANHRLSK